MAKLRKRTRGSVEIEQQIELAMATELAALYDAAPDSLTQSLGLQHAIRGGAILVGAAHVPSFHFNRVTAFGMSSPISATDFADVCSFYQPLKTQFALSISPSVDSTRIVDLLHQYQFVPSHRTAILSYAHKQIPDSITSFSIQRIGKEHALPFSETLVEAFDLPTFMTPWMSATIGQPNWHHYLAWDGSTPIATGTLYIHKQVGHFGWAATLPKYRGQGAHSALIIQRIRDAREFGCDIVAVDTNADSTGRDNISFHNLCRLGFDLLFTRTDYLSSTS